MSGYTKLFGSIVASTIWREDNPTRIVWITMLAMANQHGEVEASVPGLADLARVSVEDCRAALEKLSGPDPDSRTEDFEGRRIQAIDGGWFIINHAKYREKENEEYRKQQAAIRSKRYRERKSGVTLPSRSVTPRHVSSRQAEAEAEAEANTDSEAKAEVPPISPSARPVSPDKAGLLTQARILIHHLNEKTGRHFRETACNLTIVSERLSEPEVTVGGCMQMINRQCDRWLGTEQSEYLRPETLFRKSKFDGYYAAKDAPIDKPLVNGHKSMLDLEITKMTREADRITQNIQ